MTESSHSLSTLNRVCTRKRWKYILCFVFGCLFTLIVPRIWQLFFRGQRSCSKFAAHFVEPKADFSKCNTWGLNTQHNHSQFDYPNQVKIYTCPESKKRIIQSNGIPDHFIHNQNPNYACEVPWRVVLPLEPVYKNKSMIEPPMFGIIGMALNGVPIFGATEGHDLGNAVEPHEDSPIQDALHWHGHASPHKTWHYHSPLIGFENMVSETTKLGYSLDGFPIFGAVNNASVLDACNGQFVNGQYQYHVRSLNQVDETQNYCPNPEYLKPKKNTTSTENTKKKGGGFFAFFKNLWSKPGPAPHFKDKNNHFGPGGNNYGQKRPKVKAFINWNYVLGCYHGSLGKTVIGSSLKGELPDDCVE